MRIIGGQLAGKTLKTVFPEQVKPTTDMMREALFSRLEQQLSLDDLRVLDLFSGSGIVSLEFLSRGCHVVSVDRDRKNQRIWQQVQKEWALEHWDLRCADVLQELSRFQPESFDLVFADPPYDLPGIQLLPSRIFPLLKSGGWFILEHRPDILFPNPQPKEGRQYGRSALSFFQKD
jgi:16S rRNA (guanine966-N2)-methyltransferase